ncbi:uncharacterized protein LOC133716788 [Rosa rugosa]|uniref:uncharacterized protein LOC133716788 n=1 Tax=Rosa rugosa TaxID=74645 RepID=UPI002B405272|nr:uncharacterized protein LOC133716788 [Rosa rugosa]
MGNFAGKDKGVVHPVDENEGEDRTPSPNSLMRIKVRMTKRQLKELMAQVETNKLSHGNSEELGSAILLECLEGRLSARVVAAAAERDQKVSKYERGWMLSTVSEEEEEHQHLL